MKWKILALSELCANPDDIRCGPFGTQLNKDEFRENGVPLWGIKQVNVNFTTPTKEFVEPKTAKRLSQYDLIPGDLVMTRKGTVGNCAVYPPSLVPGIMHSDLLRIRLNRIICDSSFLVHQLHHSQDVARQLALISGGAIMPGINVGRLKQLKVAVPPLAEQKRIAGILDKADELRAKRRESLAQLDSLLQSTFLELFGDPVTNPMGWKTEKLGNVAIKITDGTHHSPRTTKFGVPYITAKHLKKDGLQFFADPWYVSEEDHASIYSRCDPVEGDVLYIKDGATTGIAAINRYSFPFSMLSSLALIRPSVAMVTSEYLCHWLNNGRNKSVLLGKMGGAAIQRLTLAKIKAFQIPLPPMPLQRRFVTVVESVERQKAHLRAHLAELDALFASLQHRAFQGDL